MNRRCASLSLVLAVFAGCTQSDPGPPRVDLKGKVSYNGSDIADGTIAFYPEKGSSGIPTSAVIKDGAYDVSGRFGIAPGTYRVEFKAFKPGAKPAQSDGIERPTGSGFETRQQTLPDKFHVGSTEKLTIKGDEKTLEKSFDLKD